MTFDDNMFYYFCKEVINESLDPYRKGSAIKVSEWESLNFFIFKT